MKPFFVSCLMLVSILLISSCKDGSTSPDNRNLNAPVITNVTNSFTYSLHANLFSDNASGILLFSSDSLVVTLASTEYSSGSSIVAVRDSLSAVIFADTVRSNKTTVIAGLKTTRPRSYSINASSFTGKMVFVIVGQ